MATGTTIGTGPVWGDGVKVLRHLKGWTQQDLAATAGVPQSTVSDIEGGKRRASELARVKIAKAFNVDPHKLFPYLDEDVSA